MGSKERLEDMSDKKIIAAVKTLIARGYTYKEGAEKWRPPVGEEPNLNLRDVVKEMQHIGWVNKVSLNFYGVGLREYGDPDVWPAYAFKEDLEK